MKRTNRLQNNSTTGSCFTSFHSNNVSKALTAINLLRLSRQPSWLSFGAFWVVCSTKKMEVQIKRIRLLSSFTMLFLSPLNTTLHNHNSQPVSRPVQTKSHRVLTASSKGDINHPVVHLWARIDANWHHDLIKLTMFYQKLKSNNEITLKSLWIYIYIDTP